MPVAVMYVVNMCKYTLLLKMKHFFRKFLMMKVFQMHFLCKYASICLNLFVKVAT